MTEDRLKQLVAECVAVHFEEMTTSGIIPADADPSEVQESYQETVDGSLDGFKANPDLYRRLLTGDEEHARGVIRGYLGRADEVAGDVEALAAEEDEETKETSNYYLIGVKDTKPGEPAIELKYPHTEDGERVMTKQMEQLQKAKMEGKSAVLELAKKFAKKNEKTFAGYVFEDYE